MKITMHTSYPKVCQELVNQYVEYFSEKPGLHGVQEQLDTIIWLNYASDRLSWFWKCWIHAAEKAGLIYDAEVK